METGKENRVFSMVLLVLITAAVSFTLVFAVSLGVQAANAPMLAYLKDIRQAQASGDPQMSIMAYRLAAVEKTVTELKGEAKVDPAKIAALEQALADIRNKPAAAMPAPAADRQGPPPEDLNKVYDIPVADSYVLGPKNAAVTIVAFTDYQCPFCGRFYPAALDAQKAYPDKVRLIIKHFPLPFHPMARPAAKAAMAAGEQGKFYEMSALIMENAAALSDDKFKELAGKVGINVARFQKDLKDKDAAFEKIITADMELVKTTDVRGTPTYFLNGRKTNARDLASWKQEIDAVLKK